VRAPVARVARAVPGLVLGEREGLDPEAATGLASSPLAWPRVLAEFPSPTRPFPGTTEGKRLQHEQRGNA
jgi:hypothetical protein